MSAARQCDLSSATSPLPPFPGHRGALKCSLPNILLGTFSNIQKARGLEGTSYTRYLDVIAGIFFFALYHICPSVHWTSTLQQVRSTS